MTKKPITRKSATTSSAGRAPSVVSHHLLEGIIQVADEERAVLWILSGKHIQHTSDDKLYRSPLADHDQLQPKWITDVQGIAGQKAPLD
jgi:hypothetical protein